MDGTFVTYPAFGPAEAHASLWRADGDDAIGAEFGADGKPILNGSR